MPLRSKAMLASADFFYADFKELFKTASVLTLRWWLQFRSLLGSASRKKLKLLLYHNVYLESRLCRVELPVDHLQATVMAYSSLESKIAIVCSVCSGKVGKPAVEYSTVQPLLLLRAKGLRLHIYQNANKASS